MTTVYGIDIQKGNIRSATVHPRFCFVKVINDKIVTEGSNLSLPRFFRFLKREKPDVLAVNSVQEIARDDAAIFRFLSTIPAETALVLATGDGTTMDSLPQISTRYNLKLDKANPAQEARVMALIASHGGGFEVVAFEGATTIFISRSRSLGRGGWRQNWYVRKIHSGSRLQNSCRKSSEEGRKS